MGVMIVTRARQWLPELRPARLEQPERLGGGGPAEHPAGPVVELGGDRVHVVLGERGQVGILGQVLAQQPITVFSFVPRCQGWCESQKNTGIDSAAVAWLAISRPRSH